MNMRDDKLSEQFRCAQGNTGQLLHRWANSERCQSNSRAVVDINAHLNDWSQHPTRDSAVLVRFRCGFSAIRKRLASYFIGIKGRISSSRKRKRKRRVMAIVELISNRIFTRVVFFFFVLSALFKLYFFALESSPFLFFCWLTATQLRSSCYSPPPPPLHRKCFRTWGDLGHRSWSHFTVGASIQNATTIRTNKNNSNNNAVVVTNVGRNVELNCSDRFQFLAVNQSDHATSGFSLQCRLQNPAQTSKPINHVRNGSIKSNLIQFLGCVGCATPYDPPWNVGLPNPIRGQWCSIDSSLWTVMNCYELLT